MRPRKKHTVRILFFMVVFACMAAPLTSADASGGNGRAHADLLLDNSIWKYRAGDNPAWARPGLDESGWREIAGNQAAAGDGNDITWFRCSVCVDSALAEMPLGMNVLVSGSADIYLNGELMLHVPADSGGRSAPLSGMTGRIFQITFPKSGINLLAVRHAISPFSRGKWRGFRPVMRVEIDTAESLAASQIAFVKKIKNNQLILMTICLGFSFLFLVIFLFSRQIYLNLYFALLTVVAAVNIYSEFQMYLTMSAAHLIWLKRAAQISFIIFPVACLRFVYSAMYRERPKLFLLFCTVALSLSAMTFLQPYATESILYLFYAIVIAEIVRVFIQNRVKPALIEDSRIIFISIMPLLLSLVFEIIKGLHLIHPWFSFVDFPSAFYAMVCFVIGMSVFLAKYFSRINHQLETELVNVKLLSEKNLRQEIEANKQAIQTVKLEAENQRKSKELNDARELQLSMLPVCGNDIPGFDICFSMKPATEVGGDYYDYIYNPDGTLTMVIGDATGHGMKAGLMVSVIKSLFISEAAGADIVAFFNKCSRTIAKMKLGNLYMSLLLLKIRNRTVQLSAAGMPPVFIFRQRSRSIECLTIPGLPLGGPAFPYEERELHLYEGDVMLLMSDGYPELFNPENQMLDYDPVKHVLEQAADLPAADIVEALYRFGTEWSDGRQQEDDITFAVVKVKESG